MVEDVGKMREEWAFGNGLANRIAGKNLPIKLRACQSVVGSGGLTCWVEGLDPIILDGKDVERLWWRDSRYMDIFG